MTIPPPPPPPPPPHEMDFNVELGPHYPWWVVVIAMALVAFPMVYLLWTCATGGCNR